MYYLVNFVTGRLIAATAKIEIARRFVLTPDRAIYTKMSTVEIVIKYAKENKCEK